MRLLKIKIPEEEIFLRVLHSGGRTFILYRNLNLRSLPFHNVKNGCPGRLESYEPSAPDINI